MSVLIMDELEDKNSAMYETVSDTADMFAAYLRNLFEYEAMRERQAEESKRQRQVRRQNEEQQQQLVPVIEAMFVALHGSIPTVRAGTAKTLSLQK